MTEHTKGIMVGSEDFAELSFRDTSDESFYHVFVLGIRGTALKNRNREFIDISSNAESGDGYSDILITDRQHHLGVIIEFKKTEDKNLSSMNRACLQGLEQIITKQYDTKLKREGCQDVISYGIAFSGKYCAVLKGQKDK